MAIKSEISWNRLDADGIKTAVYARRFGGEWQFFYRHRRYEDWQPLDPVPLEDWQSLLDGVRRRVPRRLFPPNEITRIERAIRERFPEHSPSDS